MTTKADMRGELDPEIEKELAEIEGLCSWGRTKGATRFYAYIEGCVERLRDHLHLRGLLQGVPEPTSTGGKSLDEYKREILNRPPDGWVLVPREPHLRSVISGIKALDCRQTDSKTRADNMRDIYRAMLSAAPLPERA